MKSIFVTATDTGVGKTFVAAGIAGELTRRGIVVAVMKPVATGGVYDRRLGRLVSSDALALKSAIRTDIPYELTNPVCLRRPLAPAVAARMEHSRVDMGRVWSTYRRLKLRYEVVIVEGIGGLMVPITGDFTVGDMAKRMRLPVLVVARPNLGTINHTGLTITYARSLGLEVIGVVINYAASGRRGLAERTNPAEIERFCRVRVVGEVPHFPRGAGGAQSRVFARIVERIFPRFL